MMVICIGHLFNHYPNSKYHLPPIFNLPTSIIIFLYIESMSSLFSLYHITISPSVKKMLHNWTYNDRILEETLEVKEWLRDLLTYNIWFSAIKRYSRTLGREFQFFIFDLFLEIFMFILNKSEMFGFQDFWISGIFLFK